MCAQRVHPDEGGFIPLSVIPQMPSEAHLYWLGQIKDTVHYIPDVKPTDSNIDLLIKQNNKRPFALVGCFIKGALYSFPLTQDQFEALVMSVPSKKVLAHPTYGMINDLFFNAVRDSHRDGAVEHFGFRVKYLPNRAHALRDPIIKVTQYTTDQGDVNKILGRKEPVKVWPAPKFTSFIQRSVLDVSRFQYDIQPRYVTTCPKVQMLEKLSKALDWCMNKGRGYSTQATFYDARECPQVFMCAMIKRVDHIHRDIKKPKIECLVGYWVARSNWGCDVTPFELKQWGFTLYGNRMEAEDILRVMQASGDVPVGVPNRGDALRRLREEGKTMQEIRQLLVDQGLSSDEAIALINLAISEI